MSIRRSEIAVKSAALNHVAMGATCSAVGFIAAGYLEEEDDRTKGWLQLRSPDDYKNAALGTFSPSLPAVYNIFVFSISKNHEFASLVRDVSQGRYTGGDEMQVSERIMPLCFACYSEAEKLLRSESGESTALRAAEAEVEHLRLQINSCNLSALKQIEAMRTGGDTELEDERHQFYEPLQYMNPETKELVLLCMFQKLRQLDMDTAAEPLTKSLVEMIHSMGGKGEVRRGRSEEESGQDYDIKGHSSTKAASNKQAAQASKKLMELEAKLEESQKKIREMADMAMQTEEKLRKANENLRDMAMQCEAATAEARTSQDQLAAAEGQLRKLEEELQRAREEVASQAGKTALLESQAQEAQERLRSLEAEKLSREAKIKELEKEEVAKLRTRGDGQVSGVQTDLTGDEIDRVMDENTKLKVMLEEMKAKLADLAEDMKSKGVDVSKAMEKAGLQRFLGTRSIFERLYQDAVDRIDRMEKLREKYAKDRLHQPGPESLQKNERSGMLAPANMKEAQQLPTMDHGEISSTTEHFEHHGHGPRTLVRCRACGRRMSDVPEVLEDKAFPLSIEHLEASVRTPHHGKHVAELLTDAQGVRLPPPRETRLSQGCHVLWADELFEDYKSKSESPSRRHGGPNPSSETSGVEDIPAQSRRWLPGAAEVNAEGPVGATRTGLLIVGGGSSPPAPRRRAPLQLGKSVSLPALNSNPQAAQATMTSAALRGGRRKGTDIAGALC